jgi:hypothetical protein
LYVENISWKVFTPSIVLILGYMTVAPAMNIFAPGGVFRLHL